MDARRRLASLVLESGWTISGTARELGVARQTAQEWARRARCEGIAQMCERSRRPLHSPGRTMEEVQRLVLGAAAEYPAWGPKTRHALPGRAARRSGSPSLRARGSQRALASRLQAHRVSQGAPGGPLGPRRCDAVLHRASGGGRSDAGLGVGDALGGLRPVRAARADSHGQWSGLSQQRQMAMELFRFASDAARDSASSRPALSSTDSGQGRALSRDARARGPLRGELRRELSRFRDRYNWLRPHHALAMRTPGSLYAPSARVRPARMPEPFFPAGAELRRCDDSGVLSYKGRRYKLVVRWPVSRSGFW